jgi:GAF domain-containing protein/ANTAR domain-containing protein
VAVDRQIVARTVEELRRALPEADDLLAGLLRVAEATRTVLEVDGAGLTLVHEDGPPRWVAATDAAMELLVQVQHDFGEGPYLQAYAQDRAVVIQDMEAAPTWTRLAAVVGQLHVCGVLSVPIRLADQPVGTLDMYSSQPRAWTAHELEAAGEFAAVAGELVHTSVALAARELELAQLRQALTNRVWIEQAKGVLAATQGTDPEAAFQQLRARAQAAEQALEAAQADLAERRAVLDQAQVAADERDRIADERDRIADERERAANDRDRIADERDHVADERDRRVGHPDRP